MNRIIKFFTKHCWFHNYETNVQSHLYDCCIKCGKPKCIHKYEMDKGSNLFAHCIHCGIQVYYFGDQPGVK